MNKLILLTALAYTVTAVPTTQSSWKKPWFCHNLGCPEFTTLENHTDYEVRQYIPSVWVSSMFSNVTLDSSVTQGLFFKLFSYIQGKNSASQKIAMTSPVLDEIDNLPNGKFNITRSFMVPYEFHPNPPTPNDPTVFIKRYPAMKVYVKSFPGFNIELQRPTKIAELRAAINDNTLYDNNREFSAGYDSPFAIAHRHNEVWLVAV